MLFNILILVLAQLATITLALPTTGPATDTLIHSPKVIRDIRGAVHCETSGGSPLVSDIQGAIDKLKIDPAKMCRQTNGGKSVCTTLVTSGTVSVGICGVLLGSAKCVDVAKVVNELKEKCQSGGRVGGIFNNDAIRIIVFSA